jgi:DNA-binding GntR family transcriptional regulator
MKTTLVREHRKILETLAAQARATAEKALPNHTGQCSSRVNTRRV